MWNTVSSMPRRGLLNKRWANTDSLVGRKGYRAPPGNQFLIDVSRLEKYHRKRFAMLQS